MNPTELKKLHKEIGDTEDQFFNLQKKLTELKKELPAEEIKDYTLLEKGGKQVLLSDLFGDRKDLIVIHNMGKGCPYCTLWADGFNGLLDHLENRSPIVLVSPNDPETQQEFAESRGWKFRMISHKGSSFSFDLGFEDKDGSQGPGVSTLKMDENGKIFRVGKSFFGPGDLFCSVWHIFDMLADGANGWQPDFSY